MFSRPFICLSVRQAVGRAVCLSVCLSGRLSVCEQPQSKSFMFIFMEF